MSKFFFSFFNGELGRDFESDSSDLSSGSIELTRELTRLFAAAALSSVRTGGLSIWGRSKVKPLPSGLLFQMHGRLLRRGGQNNGIGGRPEFEPNPRGSGGAFTAEGDSGQVGSWRVLLLTIQAIVNRY